MDLGFHLAYLNFDSGAEQLGPTLARTARDAEAAGIKRLTVMDHFWQIHAYGPPELNMLEAYTFLGFLAANTKTALLHTMVTGVVYREPGLLAKAVSTLDVLSGGRAGLGIGAAWNEEESRGLGIPFPPIAERFERLEEAIQIALQMWSESDAPYDGTHYQLGRTLSVPATVSQPRPYLIIGGVGERKTLRMVAKYADASNWFASADFPHLIDVLKGHCDAVGRDYATIEKTAQNRIDETTTRDSLLRELERLRGFDIRATYFSSPLSDPARVVDLLGSVAAEVAEW
ncbi:MAG: LLM class F420-dependent oxidoreductase [Microbacteriaceae bacterium]|nr:LLM class F420-dependent oxidoreductase [Microbacteriaceae bacterium]MCL2795044.1 LLM class F420-dependent oxidoreductase [Microbacteriaceae bacterium]